MREATELVRDATDDLIYDHSRRVYASTSSAPTTAVRTAPELAPAPFAQVSAGAGIGFRLSAQVM
ncbi:hypothetical protein [Streptomyces varsoviensis]|uniref:Uncharacterized protein n=1 Tax=Streptomyces varsoviensis TaxID=67373 RepID=A0ABR5J6W0_9ACTN|nr:hypothetical protein [Streptomyces varsoviensis]KOG89145.1 hypothetical protein ADK38_15880 [Streptomyces varsoviensis]